jgi:hypothetical protein
MKAAVKTVLLICVILWGLAIFQKDKLPDKEDILKDLYQPPTQTQTTKRPFEIEKQGITYTIKPLYSYRLYGLVVSYFDASTWWDIYHHADWRDFINIKDICVIWGANLDPAIYKKMKFWSMNFSCNCQTKDDDAWHRFSNAALSNNHLLVDDRQIAALIKAVGKGDQIYLAGYLAEYSHSGQEFKRGSSTTREDSGGHACETVYVTDFKILKPANPLWRAIHRFSKYGIFIMLALGLFIHFKTAPYA